MSRRLIASPSVTPDPTLRHALRHVSSTYHARLQERLKVHGVSESEYVAMFALKRLPGISSAEVSRLTAVTPQAGNQIVKSLLDRDLVSRRPSDEHGWVLLIELTPEGRRVIEECERDADDIEAAMCEGMTSDESAELMRLLRLAAVGLNSPISTAKKSR